MINLRKIITHEKHISDIVHQFNTNNNFDLQHYLRMIDKTKYKDILPLSSKKAFNTFMQKTPHLKVKDILEFKNKYSNWTLKNFRSNNLKLSDIASDNKIKTFCDSNPNDEMCKCYYDIKTILENYNICYEVLGRQSEIIISKVLINSDFGISTTPYFQTEKSGVYAAYREHQISTICVSRKWTPTKGQYNIPQIIKYNKNNLNLISTNAEVFDLNCLVDKFINSMSKI